MKKRTETKEGPTPTPAKVTGAEPRAALPEGRPSRVYSPRANSKAAKTAKTAGKSALGKLAAFDSPAPFEAPAPLVSRFEVQKQTRSGAWGTLWSEGPVRFDTLEEAEAEEERVFADWSRGPAHRVIRVDDVLMLSALDLDEFAVPLVARFWRLHRPEKEREDFLQPFYDRKRRDVEANWARLSGWEGSTIYFAPEVELPGLWRRFPFARPRTVEDVVRLLTLHELAHYALGHNGLSTSLDHEGTREELREKFAAMEREADVLTAHFWREGLTSATVPKRLPRGLRRDVKPENGDEVAA